MAEADNQALEAIIDAAMRGEYSIEHALELVAPPRFSATLDIEWVAETGNEARPIAREGGWRALITPWRILLKAVGPKPDGVVRFVRQQIAIADWIFIVTEAIKDIPDGALFEEGRLAGEEALALAIQADDPYWQYMQLQRLGALYFLPYSIHIDREQVELRRWLQRASTLTVAQEKEMPSALEAMTRATDYFERMVALSGDNDGFGYKCIAQSLYLRRRLGEEGIEDAAIKGYAEKALEELTDPDWRLETMHLLGETDKPARQGALRTEIERAEGDDKLTGPLMALRSAASVDPAYAATLAERLWFEVGKSETRRAEVLTYYRQALVTLTDIERFLPRGDTPLSSSSYDDAYADFLAYQEESAAPDLSSFREIIAFSALSGRYDAERTGIEALRRGVTLIKDSYVAAAQMATASIAMMAVDAAVNPWNAGDYTQAARDYFLAARYCLITDLDYRAKDALLRGIEALAYGDWPEDLQVIFLLAGVGPPIEAADESGKLTDYLLRMWSEYIAASIARGYHAGILAWLLQAAKGALYSTSLATPKAWNFAKEQDTHSLLDRRAGLLDDGAAPLPGTGGETASNEFFLAGVDAAPQREGASADERLFNVERAFDAAVQQKIARGLNISADYLTDTSDWETALGARSALLILHSARSDEDHVVHRVLIATRDQGLSLAVTDGGGALGIRFGLSINDATLDDLGFYVIELRSWIQKGGAASEPAFGVPPIGDGDRDAADAASGGASDSGPIAFNHLSGLLLGGPSERLTELKAAGIDHLAIWAHGSSHFLPWHLLQYGEGLLGDAFTVTYLSSLTQLRPRVSEEPSERSGTVALGLTFERSPAPPLAPLPAVRAELDSIARSSGATILIDEDATESRLLDALASAKRVHIATHGEQNPAAPAFHRIHMMPDAASDGTLHAWEILSLDLAGLELVTLSACETALGRIDRSDNHRGFAAALVQAGAESIIATLWPVSDEASAFFFSALYARLARGDPRLAAFAWAQREVRREFPEPRDWGAFHYSGRW